MLELKLLHKALESTPDESIKQTWMYMDKTGAESGHLLLFDKSKSKSWEEKIFRQEREFNGSRITVWGM